MTDYQGERYKPQNGEERYLAAHIEDLCKLAAKTGVPRFSSFLDGREAAVAALAAGVGIAGRVFAGSFIVQGAARDAERHGTKAASAENNSDNAGCSVENVSPRATLCSNSVDNIDGSAGENTAGEFSGGIEDLSGHNYFSRGENCRGDGCPEMPTDVMFFGGMGGAERTVCGVFRDTYGEGLSTRQRLELFPIRAVTLSFGRMHKLSHRDFLGAVLSQGLKRAVVGDILVAEDHAVVFCLETALDAVCGITKVGGAGVSAELGVPREIPRAKTSRTEATVASLRVDCVVSAALNISREKSAALVKNGLVSADFSSCKNAGEVLREGALLSIRGFGRFRLTEVSGMTKKGRVRVVIERFL